MAEHEYEVYSEELRVAAATAVPSWVARCVVQRCEQAGVSVDDGVLGAAAVAGVAAGRQVDRELRALAEIDVDDQRVTPLGILRRAVRHPTRVLSEIGVAPGPRDEFSARMFPEDLYDLTPSSFSEVDESLHEPGLRWGAAKAHVHLSRRRSTGPD